MGIFLVLLNMIRLLIILLLIITPLFAQVAEKTLPFPNENALGLDREEVLTLSLTPSNLAVDEVAEEEMLKLVNEERKKAGLKELIMDEELLSVARAHSLDMWQKKYFAHENREGETPFERMEEGGADFYRAGENLALARTLERAHQGLMNSPGHRKNILDENFTRVGIGIIDGGIYGKMVTQNFAD